MLGLVFWVLGLVFRVLGFVFWVLGFVFWVLGFVVRRRLFDVHEQFTTHYYGNPYIKCPKRQFFMHLFTIFA